MNSRTKTDFSSVIVNWRTLQKQKLKKKNMYPCMYHGYNATLTLISHGERRLEVHCENGISIIIPLNSIRGFSAEGDCLNISITNENNPTVLLFSNPDTQAVAIEAFEDFINEPTAELLPSSTESDD